MDWNTIAGFIDTRLVIVLAACWVIGYGLKRTPSVPDWSILYIVITAAVLLTGGVIGYTVEAIVQGIIVGAVAVAGHQAFKQAREGAVGK
ncbi:phage holin family protein [Cohnella boryungensis]|uniref:Phage holin family protein n=1 Tax=Cohnella boryungensis TaxID=768479 RepID=A0ABV8SF29_9BACL